MDQIPIDRVRENPLTLTISDDSPDKKKPILAGHADRDVPNATHSCLMLGCTLRTCNEWREYATKIGRITEVAPGEYQSNSEVAWHVMDPLVMREVAKVLKEGDHEYGRNAWHKYPPEIHINHAIDHLFMQLAEGDSNENHLANAMCRIMFAYGVYMRTRHNRLAVGQARIEVESEL